MDTGKGNEAAAAAVKDFDSASDSSHFSLITPPSPPTTSSCSKCPSQTLTHEKNSDVTQVEKSQERDQDEKSMPTKPTKSGPDAPEPCIHSLTEQTSHLSSQLTEVEAALLRYQWNSAVDAYASTAKDDSLPGTSEQKADRQEQTVASLRADCRQLWERVIGLFRQIELETKDRGSSVENYPAFYRGEKEDVGLAPQTPDQSKTGRERFDPADRKWCLELVKDAFVTSRMDDANSSTMPVLATDILPGPWPSEKKKTKSEGINWQPEAFPTIPSPPSPGQYGMPPAEQPSDPFQAFYGTEPLPDETLDQASWYSRKRRVNRTEVRWWIRSALLVTQILCMVGMMVAVFKAPGLLSELLDVLHPRNKDHCIGFRIRG